MIEQVFTLSFDNKKLVEKTLFDENIHYLHMIFPKDEGLPIHNSNATVYMTVIKGRLSLGLGEQETNEYKEGTMLKIPFGVRMSVRNLHDDLLELIVVKSPAPQQS